MSRFSLEKKPLLSEGAMSDYDKDIELNSDLAEVTNLKQYIKPCEEDQRLEKLDYVKAR